MASFGTLKADTLTHSTAGSLATNFVVEGSAKAWLNLNGTGTIATRDSFNVTSALPITEQETIQLASPRLLATLIIHMPTQT